MAADILLFDSNIVPVGKTKSNMWKWQRDIATSFNHTLWRILTIPDEAKVDEVVATVSGTDGLKCQNLITTLLICLEVLKLSKTSYEYSYWFKRTKWTKRVGKLNIYSLCKLFMSEDELASLRARYATSWWRLWTFKINTTRKNKCSLWALCTKKHYLNNSKEVKRNFSFGHQS